MQNLGLFSQAAVDEMTAGNEYIEYSEGTLLDNFIFWELLTMKKQSIIVMLHELTCMKK